jgi:PAS domain S-box-containing protein
MISVLLVDDEPVLLDIGRIFLERTNEFTVTQADSAKEALLLLGQTHYDAIVSDYEMPTMDGLAFLAHVRSSWPDVPFILFTGRGREEVVIEALNSGADFYLQKGGDPKSQFTELTHKIKQAVLTRRSVIELKESEETFRQFFNAAGDAIIILDGQTIVDCNNRGIELFEDNREGIIGRSPVDFSTPVQPDGRNCIQSLKDAISKALDGIPASFEWRICTSLGKIIESEVSMSKITIHGRTLLHAIVRDISERKHNEEIRRINEFRLEAMLGLYSIRDSDLKTISDYALEQTVAITGSQYGYLAFVSKNESVITMYSWSGKASTECRVDNRHISYDIDKTGEWGDAVRMRRPVINNAYCEKTGNNALPIGHVPLTRHMNIPILDKDRIVLLAGVSNKGIAYTEEDIRQITLLMTGMWGIIRRKKTEEILQKKNFELAAAYEQLRTIEEELRKRYEDIRN